MPFIDSHAHLADERFDADRAAVLERARRAGVERILTIGNGTARADFEKTLALVEQHKFLWAALGVHPHDARHADEDLLACVEVLAGGPRVLAWGEIGLDYHYDHSPRAVQQQAFRWQLQRARALRLAVIIHCREAWDDCLRILSEEWAASGLGGILHCFSGTAEVARRALEWGFLISFAGNVTFPRAENLREAAQAVPLDRLVLETDSPYLAPQAVRGKRNEPARVLEVAETLGRLHGLTREAMGARTSENFLRLFPRARA
ncbi:MAG: TatD family hydrolase [Terriglobia bacterium]